MMEEHQQMMAGGQEYIDANSYVQGLIEKTSKMSEGLEEEEYGEEEAWCYFEYFKFICVLGSMGLVIKGQ